MCLDVGPPSRFSENGKPSLSEAHWSTLAESVGFIVGRQKGRPEEGFLKGQKGFPAPTSCLFRFDGANQAMFSRLQVGNTHEQRSKILARVRLARGVRSLCFSFACAAVTKQGMPTSTVG